MPERFPPAETHLPPGPEAKQEGPPAEDVPNQVAPEAVDAPPRLNWELGEHDGEPILVAEDAAVPEWYLQQGYDTTEHRRPAVVMKKTGAGTTYTPAWIFFGDRSIHQPLAPAGTMEEAEAMIARVHSLFVSSATLEEHHAMEEELHRQASGAS